MEFRKMRRFKQQLSEQATEEVLRRGDTAVLGVINANGYPYTVPVNYLYAKGRIYFHCAKQGEKLDAIRQNDKVSLCVIDQDDIQPEKLTTFYRSVIVFGRARILEDMAEIHDMVEAMGMKYLPDKKAVAADIARRLNNVVVIEVSIEHMTGKESMELVRMR